MNTKKCALLLLLAGAMLLAACGAEPSGSQPPTAARPPADPASSAPSAASVLPDGVWQVDLTADDLLDGGAPAEDARGGVYRWTFDGTRARITVEYDDGERVECDADASAMGDAVRLSYRPGQCGGEVDTLSWAVEADGLHFDLTSTNAPFEANQAYLEAKPWQQVDGDATLTW